MKMIQERTPASIVLERNVKKILEGGKWYRANKTCEIDSLAHLAQKMGIAAPSLTHALKGNPRLDTIQKIADALNVPVSSLFNEEGTLYGEIVIDGKVMYFHSLEDLKSALEPLHNMVTKK